MNQADRAKRTRAAEHGRLFEEHYQDTMHGQVVTVRRFRSVDVEAARKKRRLAREEFRQNQRGSGLREIAAKFGEK